MPTTAPKSGVFETTQTTGTGAYTLDGAQSGYRALVAGDDGKQFHYAVWAAGGFEAGVGTYTNTGRAFARTTILANHLGTTSPVNWGAGSKNFGVIIPGERVAMLDVVNTWLADQHLGSGNDLSFDGDQDTYLTSPSDDQLELYVNGLLLARWLAGQQLLTLTDAGATEGPELRLMRDSVSPAASDALGVVRFNGRSSTGVEATYGKIRGQIVTATNAAEDGEVEISVAKAGTLVEALRVRGSNVCVGPAGDIPLFMIGKGASSFSTAGIEAIPSGNFTIVSSNIVGLEINRLSGDGNLVQFSRDGTLIGWIAGNAGTGVVTYQTFCGAHASAWGEAPDAEQVGAVLELTGARMAGREHLGMVRVCATQASKKVYGVYSGRNEDGSIAVTSLGAFYVQAQGPVMAGDLLQSSATPGVAEKQPGDAILSSTIGKVTVDDPGEGVRLVPCVLYCG